MAEMNLGDKIIKMYVVRCIAVVQNKDEWKCVGGEWMANGCKL